MKKPTASNSFDNFSSNCQSFVRIKRNSFSSTSLNKSIWFLILFSEIDLDVKIKFGIDSKIDFLLIFKLSKAPAFARPSNWSLFMFFGSVLRIKSFKDLNLPFFSLSFTIWLIDSKPTLLIAPKA